VGEDKAKMRLAVTLLFTFPGVPCLYYGDEVGLTGAGDPDNRRCMPWQSAEWDVELREFYRTIINLRRTSITLQQGGFQIVYAGGDTLAFQRESPTEKLLVVARRSDDGLTRLPMSPTGIPDGTLMRELLSGVEEVVEDGYLSLVKLPAIAGQIWQTTSF
jgi:alpha-glucosidase